MSHFLVGLVLVSQLFAGAKDCNTRRDCEDTPENTNQAVFVDFKSKIG